MSAPAHVNLLNFFYGVGNTPAVCLTQGLAPEDDADVLLLGCGDVRNILCTTYSRGQSADRRLDITCCDIEVGIIARNVVLFTLLLDDEDNSKRDAIWSIYYHLFLDYEALALLQYQVKKLLAHSTDWDNSGYGAFLKFANTDTLDNVRHMWAAYNVTSLNEDEKSEYNSRFKEGIRRASEMRTNLTRGGVVLTSVRSAAPLGLQAIRDAPSLFQYYWMHGITQGSHDRRRRARHSNPMFASLEGDTFIHYGTDPLLGFHLAAAFLGLDRNSTLHPKDPSLSECHKMVSTAREQFQTWSNLFRESARRNVVLRFCVADAIAFCSSLQHAKVRGATTCANLYRDPWHHTPLLFDYSNRSAPFLFDVIDASNLVDNLGAINLLVAAVPLLKDKISSTIYTETLFRHEMNVPKAVEILLCGDLPTIAVLLGLFPVEYWTNATAASAIDDILLTPIMQNMYKSTGTQGGHMLRNQIVWKLSPTQLSEGPNVTSSIQFDEKELSQLMFQIYLNMFQEENVGYQKLEWDIAGKQIIPLPVRYTRASFAVLIHFLSKRVNVDWSKVIVNLIRLIRDDTSLAMGSNYFAELNLHLHKLGFDPLACTLQYLDRVDSAHCLDADIWKEMCSLFVCITLVVPRVKLKIITDMRREKLGTPLLRCTMRASATRAVHLNWENDFAALQLGFGEIRTSGTRDSDGFSVTVIEDRNSWTGNSPLIVSFYAPTLSVLVEPDDGRLVFGFQKSRRSSSTFATTLGPELNLYETYLGNQENVFITKYPPNMSGHSSIGYTTSQKQCSSSTEPASTSVTAHIDPKTSKITSYTGQVIYFCKIFQQNLLDGFYVKRVQTDPFTIKIRVGSADAGQSLRFPTPVLLSRTQTHVGRRSFYVKINTPLLHPMDLKERTDLLFPMSVIANRPVLWNLHYVNLDHLPSVYPSKISKLGFLIPHLSLMFSTRERDTRDQLMSSPEVGQEVRIEFKDSLFTMFMRFTGLQGAITKVFILVHSTTEANRATHIIIIGSCIRFDFANHTVVLDAAVLITTKEIMPQLLKFLETLMALEVAAIKVSEDELKLWKQVLPGYVERGRDWEHKTTCEYALSSRIPLSVNSEKSPICSCGLGKLPPNFITGIPLWSEVSQYAVRVAIPPCFPNPIVEPVGFDAKLKLPNKEEKACKLCKRIKVVEGEGLLKCELCQGVEYCSEKCQREDWGTHKMFCGRT